MSEPAAPPQTAPGPLPARPAAPRIGIFDSGVGGLSVLAALQQHLPQADCRYIADSAHTPWGDQSADWVQARCLQLAQRLIDDGAQLVLLACNTGTTQAIAQLRARWPQMPFVGVEPGIKPAVAASRNGRVAVMATSGTLRSARVQQLLDEHAGQRHLLRLPCPGLADAIEQASEDDAPLQQRLDAIADTLRAAAIDTVVLGCTHYPLVAAQLQQRLGSAVQLIDTAPAVARRAASLLGLADLAAHAAAAGTAAAGTAAAPCPPRLAATGSPQPLARAARHWLGLELPVELLHLDPPPGHASATPDPAARRI